MPARTPVAPARLSDGQPGGAEKECAAISQRLLRQMRAAGIVGEQDARSVHFRLDRARSSMHTEISQTGLRALNSRRIRAGLAAGKDNGSWRTFFMMTRVVMTASRPVPGRAAGPGSRDGVAAPCGSRWPRRSTPRCRPPPSGRAGARRVRGRSHPRGRARRSRDAGRATAGRLLRPGPRRAAGPPDRRQPEPGRGTAERDRAAVG